MAAEYRRVEIDWRCGDPLLDRLAKAKEKGYRLARCVFAGYREGDSGNVPHYTLIFEQVR